MKKALIFGGLSLWLVAVVAAFFLVWRYKTTPGANTVAPRTWPRDSVLVPARDRANLLLFAHPQCPCTRASMTELARLASELGQDVRIQIVVVRPHGTDQGFEEGTVLDRAKAIPGATVFIDDDGKEANRFGAQTSGTAVLYGRDGKLGFSGGITSARGHEGDAPGQSRIVEVVHGTNHTAFASAPTFGCALEDIQTASSR